MNTNQRFIDILIKNRDKPKHIAMSHSIVFETHATSIRCTLDETKNLSDAEIADLVNQKVKEAEKE